MSINNFAAHSLFPRASRKLKNFFYSNYYLVHLALMTAFFYCANLPAIGLTCFALVACITLLLFEDLTPFLPLHLFVVLIFRDFSVFNSTWIFLVFVPVAICLILHFVFYPIKKIYIGKLFIPLVLVSVSILLGGIFSPYFSSYAGGLVTTLTVGPLILFDYFLFSQYLKPPKYFDLKKYFFFIFCMVALTSCIELFVHRFGDVAPHNSTHLGWASVNTVATILLFAIPACWYLMLYSRQNLIFLVLLLLFYCSMYLTNSDGGCGTAFSMLPVIILTILLKGRLKHNKYRLFKFAVITIALIFIICLIIALSINQADYYINLLLAKLSNDNNRTKLYKEALSLFLSNPIFGIGNGYIPPDGSFIPSGVVTYNFHSTFFHVLATMGIVGIISYVVYFIARFRIICCNNSPFNIFAYFSFAMFEIYAMIDTGEFCVIPLLLCITALFFVTEKVNAMPPLKEPLELEIHNFNHFIKRF